MFICSQTRGRPGRPWLVALALAAAVACSGREFAALGDDANSGGESGKSGEDGRSGNGNTAGIGPAGAGGRPAATGGQAGGGGEPDAAAGESGAAGEASGGFCENDVGVGIEHASHCYADVTAQKEWTQPAAVTTCQQLAASFGRTGYLLSLETEEEQAFVLDAFMQGFEEKHDAWLSLTCSETLHPQVSDCFCSACDEATLFSKRQNWLWPSEIATGFGWHVASPNGDGRCAAITHKGSVSGWRWGDRACNEAKFSTAAGTQHTYRVICELE